MDAPSLQQLQHWNGPSGPESFPEAKPPANHLKWLWNLLQWLQKVEETQNRPKKRPEWFPLAKVMPITVFLLFSPRSYTKIGVAGVSFAKNSQSAKIGGLRPKMRQPFDMGIGHIIRFIEPWHNRSNPKLGANATVISLHNITVGYIKYAPNTCPIHK